MGMIDVFGLRVAVAFSALVLFLGGGAIACVILWWKGDQNALFPAGMALVTLIAICFIARFEYLDLLALQDCLVVYEEITLDGETWYLLDNPVTVCGADYFSGDE